MQHCTSILINVITNCSSNDIATKIHEQYLLDIIQFSDNSLYFCCSIDVLQWIHRPRRPQGSTGVAVAFMFCFSIRSSRHTGLAGRSVNGGKVLVRSSMLGLKEH